MGLCCSRPEIDSDDNENTGLLVGEQDSDALSPSIPDRFAHLSPEEIQHLREEERLKEIEQQTTDALINISHRADYMHGQASGYSGGGGSGGSKDYADILRRFNQQVNLSMVSLEGPKEVRGGDVFGVLAEARISPEDAQLVDSTIERVLEAMADVSIVAPGECVVPLSLEDRSK
ncbi:hypothetical protein LPJ53_002625 [Coemansia erecta]|uniref:Uncharacterized protein n=1 Tax=Coemansia erecta TaxID=147472 RepID=A0A9W7Y1V2_9FUNG|nr:hypothetical protein LPJ53_002625 [Coemansia erecta]